MQNEIDTINASLAANNLEVIEWSGRHYYRSMFRCTSPGCGHEFGAKLQDVRSGVRFCKKCANKYPKPEDVENLPGRNIELVAYGGNLTSVSKFRCLAEGCNHEWDAMLSVVKRKSGCPKCSGNVKVTYDEAVESIKGLGIELVTYGGASAAPSTFRCKVDGHEWVTSLSQITSGRGCPKCAGTLPLTQEVVEARLEGRDVELVSYGGSVHADSRFKCTKPECGHEWDARTKSVCNEGQGCPRCGGKLKVTRDEANRRLAGRNIDLVEYDGEIRDQATFRCANPACDHVWSTVAYAVINAKQGCPACARSGFKSNQEACFYLYLITTSDSKYIGFGITNNFEQRDAQHRRSFKVAGASFELINRFDVQGYVARAVESEVKRRFPITSSGVVGFKEESVLYEHADNLGMLKWTEALMKTLTSPTQVTS